MMPGSTQPVYSIRSVHVNYISIPKGTKKYLQSPQSADVTTNTLKQVAGMLIMSPVKMSAFGFSPIMRRARLPHIRTLFKPPNFLIGYFISIFKRCSKLLIDISRKSALVSLIWRLWLLISRIEQLPFPVLLTGDSKHSFALLQSISCYRSGLLPAVRFGGTITR